MPEEMNKTICAVKTDTPVVAVRHEIYLGPSYELFVVEINTWTGARKYYPLRVKDGRIVADGEESMP